MPSLLFFLRDLNASSLRDAFPARALFIPPTIDQVRVGGPVGFTWSHATASSTSSGASL